MAFKHFRHVAYSATSWKAIGLSLRRGSTSLANSRMLLTASVRHEARAADHVEVAEAADLALNSMICR